MAGSGGGDTRSDRGHEWYRRLVERANTITTVLDPDGSIVYTSPAVERVLGHDSAEVVGSLGHEYLHPDDHENVTEAIEALRAAPEDPQTAEFRLRRADGSWCWVEATMWNQLDDDVIGGILLHGREATERRKRAAERHRTNERLKMALEGANFGVWDWNMRTDDVSRDELLTNMLGYRRSEMGDHLRDWEDVVHPDGKRRHDEALAEHVEDRTPYYECEYRLETNSGEWKWVRTIGKVVERDEGGTPVRAIGIHQDIDDRKRAELALEAREEKYRSLFEDIRDALMLLDRDGFLDCNERTLGLFGIDSVERFTEHAPWELSPPRQPDGADSREAAMTHIERAFEEGQAFFEWTHQRADGTTFPAEVKLSRFEDEDGQALHALVRDITERKAHQRQLQEQRDDLEVLNQVVRHDIRNDIQLISGHAEIVEQASEKADVQRSIEAVLDAADHANELTTSAREMANVMLSAETELRPVGLREAIERQLSAIRTTYSDARVAVEGTIPPVDVRAHDMLDSVFRNLLKNAVQHNDSETPEVTVSATCRDDSAVVRVADNGPGIPDARKTEIFGKGEVGLDSHGTGIGLYLVETLVESYDGAVWIEDRTGESGSNGRPRGDGTDSGGAVFVVELPLAET